MANPQKENGYTAISNEIMKALCKIRINGEARQVLDFILYKTYGFNKKSDGISLSQFTEETGLKRPTVCKAIRRLKDMNLITQKDTSTWNLYELQKDFETWKPLPKKITLPKKIMSVTQKDNRGVAKKIHTKAIITKATITKAVMPSEKKIWKAPNPETLTMDSPYRAFLEHCIVRSVTCEIAEKKYLNIREEYLSRFHWWEEAKSCVDWCSDNGLKKITPNRLRNWAKNAIKFNKEKELKAKQSIQDKTNQLKPKLYKPNLMPLWTPPL